MRMVDHPDVPVDDQNRIEAIHNGDHPLNHLVKSPPHGYPKGERSVP